MGAKRFALCPFVFLAAALQGRDPGPSVGCQEGALAQARPCLGLQSPRGREPTLRESSSSFHRHGPETGEACPRPRSQRRAPTAHPSLASQPKRKYTWRPPPSHPCQQVYDRVFPFLGARASDTRGTRRQASGAGWGTRCSGGSGSRARSERLFHAVRRRRDRPASAGSGRSQVSEAGPHTATGKSRRLGSAPPRR